MDYLNEIGIQRWSLRQSLPPASPAIDVVQAEETALPPVAESPAVPKVKERDSWTAIVEQLESPDGCPNCMAGSPILGEGDQNAQFVVVVDAPTVRDVREQKLLAGRDGQLLDAILGALGLDRRSVYLSSIFKCAPSDNYQVSPSCSDLLTRQLKLVAPKKVLVFGELAAQTLLRSNDPLSVLRAAVHQPRALQAAVGVTASITEILANPACKAVVWQDLCRLMEH